MLGLELFLYVLPELLTSVHHRDKAIGRRYQDSPYWDQAGGFLGFVYANGSWKEI